MSACGYAVVHVWPPDN